MDLAGFVGSLTLTDGVLVVLFILAFIMGYSQGVLRQLLVAGAFLATLILAANLRGSVGSWLASYWANEPTDFSLMVGFLTSFIILFGVCLIAIQAYYQRVELAPRYVVFDEIAGGVLATLVAMLVVGVLVLATDQFYKGTGRTPQEFDVGWLRSLHDALDGAALVHFLRGNMIPGLVTVITPFVPQAVRTVYS